jgi:curli production assembly/transport CsgH protein
MPLTSTPAIECVIRAQPDKHVLRLEAIARSDAPVAGEYSFSVAKRSPTGNSNNAQSGTFVLQGGHEQVLTTIILDRSAIGNYRAELSLRSDRERFTCTSP